MLKLTQKVTTPPGGYRFKEKATGELLTGPSFADLVDIVRRHRQANGITTNGDLEAEIEDQMCQVLPAGNCKQETGAAYDSGVGGGLTFGQVMQGTATLAHWFMGGRQRVSQDEASNRARICSACHFNQMPSGCTSCNQGALHDVVNKITGGEAAPRSDLLHGCVICGCSLKAKVLMPLDTLQPHISEEQNKKFPDWCWVKRK